MDRLVRVMPRSCYYNVWVYDSVKFTYSGTTCTARRGQWGAGYVNVSQAASTWPGQRRLVLRHSVLAPDQGLAAAVGNLGDADDLVPVLAQTARGERYRDAVVADAAAASCLRYHAARQHRTGQRLASSLPGLVRAE